MTMARAKSLQTRLLVWVLGLVTLVWLGAAALTWVDARHELDELLDGHLAQAAALLGLDSTSFVLGLAAEKAREVLSKHSVIKLSIEGQKRFAELSKNPPPPTTAMKKLKNLPDFVQRAS